MDVILNILNRVPAETWLLLAETLAAAILASPLISAFKKWLRIHRDWVALLLAIGTSMTAAALAYVVNDPTFSACLVPVHGWLIFATTQPVYRFFIKPLGRKIRAKLADAMAYQAEREAAVVPPEGLPKPPQV